MMGSTGRWSWKAVLAALVFPAVLIGYSYFLKADLGSRQTVLLSFFSFGIYWLTYLPTCAVVYFERKGRTEAAASASPAQATSAAEAAASPEGGTLAPAGKEPESVELQGAWQCDTVDDEGHPCRKLVELGDHELTLRVFDAEGHVCFSSFGEFRTEKLGPFRLLKVEKPVTPPDGDVARPPGRSSTWIYRVTGEKLRLATNLEETAVDQSPAMETYVRVGRGAAKPGVA
jgi:hypothetical protein